MISEGLPSVLDDGLLLLAKTHSLLSADSNSKSLKWIFSMYRRALVVFKNKVGFAKSRESKIENPPYQFGRFYWLAKIWLRLSQIRNRSPLIELSLSAACAVVQKRVFSPNVSLSNKVHLMLFLLGFPIRFFALTFSLCNVEPAYELFSIAKSQSAVICDFRVLIKQRRLFSASASLGNRVCHRVSPRCPPVVQTHFEGKKNLFDFVIRFAN